MSGRQFVKDHLRPKFIKHGLISAEYTDRAGLHAFRRSLASVLITEDHVDPKTAQALLRHAKPSITLAIYTHSKQNTKLAALDHFESRIAQ
jgi:integrase